MYNSNTHVMKAGRWFTMSENNVPKIFAHNLPMLVLLFIKCTIALWINRLDIFYFSTMIMKKTFNMYNFFLSN